MFTERARVLESDDGCALGGSDLECVGKRVRAHHELMYGYGQSLDLAQIILDLSGRQHAEAGAVYDADFQRALGHVPLQAA